MILCFDIATKTGICYGEGESLPHLDCLDINKEAVFQQKKRNISEALSVGAMFSTARQALIPLFAEVKPRCVVFEAPILRAESMLSITRKLQGLAGLVEELAFEFKVESFEEENTKIKMALSGYGLAEKDFQVNAALILGAKVPYTLDALGKPIYDDNAADAFGIWLCALKQVRPAVYDRVWAPRFDSDAWRQNMEAAKASRLIKLRANRQKKQTKEAAKKAERLI